jgi:hypothetical protein
MAREKQSGVSKAFNCVVCHITGSISSKRSDADKYSIAFVEKIWLASFSRAVAVRTLLDQHFSKGKNAFMARHRNVLHHSLRSII